MDHATLKQQIGHIRNLMANGRVEEAIEELRILSKTIRDSATKDEIISISSKFNRLEHDLRNQVISANDLSLKQNQLTNQVLSLLSDLEASYERVMGTKPGLTTGRNQTSTTKGERPAWLIPVAIGLVLALVLGGWWVLWDKYEEATGTCTELIDQVRTAYFADDYITASSLLDDLPSECRNEQFAQLKTKVEEAVARETKATGDSTPLGPGDTPTTPVTEGNDDTTPATSEEENGEAEKKQWCNARYLEAATYFKDKNYAAAKSAVKAFTDRCGKNERLERILKYIEGETNPPPAESRAVKSFMLHFPKAYLVSSGSTTQLIAGNPISYGQDWEVKKLKSFLYHVKHTNWKDFFWQVNTSREVVNLVREGTFGRMGGVQTKERMSVVSYPNKETPSRFQLYFDDCYLIHSPPSTLQVMGAGKVLQREDAWNVRKISSTEYHLKNKAWRTNLFWKVDLAGKKASKFRGTSKFGESGAESAERLDAVVEVRY